MTNHTLPPTVSEVSATGRHNVLNKALFCWNTTCNMVEIAFSFKPYDIDCGASTIEPFYLRNCVWKIMHLEERVHKLQEQAPQREVVCSEIPLVRQVEERHLEQVSGKSIINHRRRTSIIYRYLYVCVNNVL